LRFNIPPTLTRTKIRRAIIFCGHFQQHLLLLVRSLGKAKKSQPFNKEDADAYAGKGGLNNFFSVVPKKKKRGRPAKNAKKRGRPPRNNKSPPTPPRHLRKSPPEIAAANNDVNDGVAGPVEEAGEEEKDDNVDDEDAGAPNKKKSRINWVRLPIVLKWKQRSMIGSRRQEMPLIVMVRPLRMRVCLLVWSGSPTTLFTNTFTLGNKHNGC
jgi:hypothetical protein